MGVIAKRSGPPVKFDGQKAAQVIAGFVPGAILLRTDKGISSTGQPFAQYSQRYLKALKAMGEDTKVDLRLTSGLMNSIKERGRRITSQGVEVVIAPDTGTSPQVRAPSQTRALRKFGLVGGRFGEVSNPRPLRRGESRQLATELRREAPGHMIQTGERGPQHNVLGYWIHHGTATMKARPFMGLTREQMAELNRLLVKARVFG